MRIGLFTDAYYPIISGVSISLRILKKELTDLGHEVFIITNNHESATPEENVIRLGGYKLPMKGMGEYRIGKVTRKKVLEVGKLNLDIVHCHTEFTMGRLGRRVARKYKLPVVHTYHTMYEDYVHFISKTLTKPLRLLSKYYSRSFANSANEVLFPTIKVKKTFDRYGYKKHSHIVPTGIYLEKFDKDNFSTHRIIQLKESLKIRHDDFVLLFLGRLSREKSIEDLLIEFAKIEDPKVKLLIVGGGPDSDLFEKLVKEKGITDRVIFTGMVPPKDVGVYYHLGDLFVNFSTTETQGLTYYEALASCLPLLVKYDDNLEGVILDEVNGYSFKENSEFVDLANKLINNRQLLDEYASNACSSVEKFSAMNYAKSVEEVYLKLHK